MSAKTRPHYSVKSWCKDALRYSVKEWRKDALQAASMSVGRCKHGGTIGIDMHAQDGTPFAHGHMDPETMRLFRDRITLALAEVGGPE